MTQKFIFAVVIDLKRMGTKGVKMWSL